MTRKPWPIVAAADPPSSTERAAKVPLNPNPIDSRVWANTAYQSQANGRSLLPG